MDGEVGIGTVRLEAEAGHLVQILSYTARVTDKNKLCIYANFTNLEIE